MRIKILALFTLSISLGLNAQQYSDSPFSAYGIGETGSLDHAVYGGMGGNSVALIDSVTVNYNNPSSYAFLGFGQPIFSTGISSKFSTYSANGEHANSRIFGIDHFVLAVPFQKYFGVAFGLKQFSRMGYNFIEEQILEDNSRMRYDYKGSGSTNEAFLGLSGKVLNTKKHQVGIGINAGYIFGSVNNTRYSFIYNEGAATFPGGVDNQGIALKSFHYDLGLTYQGKINEQSSFIVGATFAPEQKLSGRLNNFFAYDYKNVYNESSYIVYSEDYTKGSVKMPSALGAGVTYIVNGKKREGKKNLSQWMISAEYKVSDYSRYNEWFENKTTLEPYGVYSKYGIGVQYTPHQFFLDRATTNSYVSKIRYRAGFQYSELPLKVNGRQTPELKYSVGFGFPLATQRSSSCINVSFTYGTRENSATVLQERFWGINFGVSIAPGFADRWFRKFKID